MENNLWRSQVQSQQQNKNQSVLVRNHLMSDMTTAHGSPSAVDDVIVVGSLQCILLLSGIGRYNERVTSLTLQLQQQQQ